MILCAGVRDKSFGDESARIRSAPRLGSNDVGEAPLDTFSQNVAEKGTEAAAATAVTLSKGAMPTGIAISADRPFLFFLRDQPTGAVLFMGRVLDPSKS